MPGVLATAFLVALLAGCGGGSDESGGSSDASQVEASVKTQLAKSGGGGVVDLGNDPPKLVTCRKSSSGEWRCTVTTAKGRSMLCLVGEEKSGRKVPPTPICGPMDN